MRARQVPFVVSGCLCAALAYLIPWPVLTAQQPDTPQLLVTQSRAEALIRAWNERLPYVPGEVLVKFKAGTTAQSQTRVLSLARGDVDASQSRWIGDAMLLNVPAEPNPDAFSRVLERQPEVEWAQPNYLQPLQARPNDPSYARQWNMDLIDLPRAWDINDGGAASVTVAVVDSGVTAATANYVFRLWTGGRFELVNVPFLGNPDISPSRIHPGRDFVFWNGPVLDLAGHGTHVAGTVLQETNNNLGLAGVAYHARLMPLKVCFGYWDLQILRSELGIPGFIDPRTDTACDTAAAVQAVRYAADNGAQIINLSLGGPGPSPAYLDALRYAVQRGAFVAVAAGNDFDSGNLVNYPAAYAAQIDGVVAVGAVGRSQRRSFYSNTASGVEVVAPGGDVRDGGEPGMVYQAGLFPPDLDPTFILRPRFDRYVELPLMGTSMASPHVAGVAALLYSQGITRPAAIEAALKRFARDLGPAGVDREYGAGLIDARATLRGLGVAR